eukprot:CAMPEP_0181376814 /NCGR_PEP_ID=MMETSP1106-20121128/17536_1 /TAXON_ID=81844 /ORGANISM="Mantoniella antarctica, Strain SL-175" /LENGTH=144 /DNA_ID=CAMNT_0023495451 /DNA_START=123 /DNA_END=554 /DNA_ORIENTATION=-
MASVVEGLEESDDGAWLTAQQIEAQLVSPPGAEVDPNGVFGGGIVVDCVARPGVLAMPTQQVIGLNLRGFECFRRARNDPHAAADTTAGSAAVSTDADSESWEYSPSAARLLRAYLNEHPGVVHAVVRSSHRAPEIDGGGFRCG